MRVAIGRYIEFKDSYFNPTVNDTNLEYEQNLRYTNSKMKYGDMIAGGGRNEDGWKFSQRYMVEDERESQNPDYPEIQVRPPNSHEVSLITDDLREHLLFLPFEDGSLHTTNFVETISREMVSQLLADAIPAESLPAGFSAVELWNPVVGGTSSPVRQCNIDMP